MKECESCTWSPIPEGAGNRVGSMGEKYFECEICEKITFSDTFHVMAKHVCQKGIRLCDRCKKAVSKSPKKCPTVTEYKIDPAIPPFEL